MNHLDLKQKGLKIHIEREKMREQERMVTRIRQQLESETESERKMVKTSDRETESAREIGR